MNDGDTVWVLCFYGPFEATIVAVDSKHKKACVRSDGRGLEVVELSDVFTLQEACYMARVQRGYAKAAEETAAAAQWLDKLSELKRSTKAEGDQ